MSSEYPIRVLFICMGNICRSPTAHGVFEALIRKEGLERYIEVDSAGTHAYHVGEQPDSRSQMAAMGRGYDLSYQRARKVVQDDVEYFDYLLAMDEANLSDLHLTMPDHLHEKISLFMEYAPHYGQREVPDPYYGGEQGFDRVLDMVEEASKGLLEAIKSRHKL
jgi:protein-tyrosine phosphatase